MTDQPILTSSTYDEGSVLHLAFSKPKGNVIDRDLVAALDAAIAAAANAVEVRVILIEGLGKNFSYGASVEEHLPDQVASMLAGFHGLFRTMIKTSTPLLAVVRGHCLGGGLELAAFCHRVFAAPEAKLGQPEINLGVFAPVASAVLPYRCGQVVADDLLLSGRLIGAAEALQLGVVDVVADDPLAAALDYARQALGGKSASSLRLAVRAARHRFHEDFLQRIESLETLYRDDLMATRDAEEGVRAFLEKRPPQWRNA